MRILVLPYKWCSLSAIALAKEMEASKIGLVKYKYRPRKSDVVINWGNSSEIARTIEPNVRLMLNSPASVHNAIDKIRFLEICREQKLPGPTWTRDFVTACEWSKKHIVVARHLAQASGGRGIEIVDKGGNVPNAKFYTLYAPKRDEFRVHVVGDKVIDYQQKKLKNGTENPNYQVRNRKNGWIFAREGVIIPEAVKLAAIQTIKCLGLDFGGVDVGWNENKQRPTVYEVNTAVGLEGTTVINYTKAIRGLIDARIKNRTA